MESIKRCLIISQAENDYLSLFLKLIKIFSANQSPTQQLQLNLLLEYRKTIIVTGK